MTNILNLEEERRLYKKGRYLTTLLRHRPEKENLKLDKLGYASVEKVCHALKIEENDLKYIVETNNKKRFIFDDAGKKIRATQGHSVKVDLPLLPIEPPYHLYHGTTIDNLDNIFANGLNKQKRNHVHLSENREIAYSVGIRHARKSHKTKIIVISSKLMHDSGYKFYKSENGVWLTDFVPPLYLKNG